MCGGTGDAKEATPDVQEIADKVSTNVELVNIATKSKSKGSVIFRIINAVITFQLNEL